MQAATLDRLDSHWILAISDVNRKQAAIFVLLRR
jgi:hypothetical protein